MLCDCDVECPNDHLLLRQKLMNGEPIYQEFPKLDKNKCKKCGICFKVCRENAIFWIKGKEPTFLYDLCTGCGACWIACPNKAIIKKKTIVGEFFVNKVRKNFWLLTGKSKPGITETGPIVREVKKRALDFAKSIKADIVIVDTSVGSHCNVVQALIGCDEVYAVTEPTPLGAYDLEVMLELAKKLDLDVKVVLNKANMGNENLIRNVVRKYGKKIVKKIPYSEELVKAYCERKLDKMVMLL